MKKITQNLFELAMLCFMLRSFIVGPVLSDALILISLVISIVYSKNYLNKSKIDEKEELLKDINLLKNEVSMLKLEKGFKKVGGYAQSPQGELRF